MELYQIVETNHQTMVASGKAQSDISVIAQRAGFCPVDIRTTSLSRKKAEVVKRQLVYAAGWARALRAVGRDSVLLVQCPFPHQQLTREATLRLLKHRGVRLIAVVHDVEALRKTYETAYYRREFRFMLEAADVLIVHSEAMKRYFLGLGVEERRLVTLGVFDYLLDRSRLAPKAMRPSVTVAGNLAPKKCGYLRELIGRIPVGLELYGPHFQEDITRGSVVYHGALPPDALPGAFTGGFGLVWDGPDARSCTGDAGEYLRCNSPHKLSLYLASGLPVLIWREAAAAGFVEERRVGIAIDSLEEIPALLGSMPEERYAQLAENAGHEGERLSSGHYTAAALREALERLGA